MSEFLIVFFRFHLDSVDFNTVEQDPNVEKMALLDSQIIGLWPKTLEYKFPDYVYTDEELCTMLFMFSHIFLNNTQGSVVARGKRATYQFSRNEEAPVNSDFVTSNDNYIVNQYPIQEKGIVSFRQDKSEAIAPAKVFIGIIASLTSNPILSGKTISKAMMAGTEIPNEVTLKDGLLAVTFGNMMGTASFYEINNQQNDYNQDYIYGMKGTWVNQTCCTYYGIDQVTSGRLLRRSNRGSLAQIRGSLDGYIIGKNLQNMGATQANQLRLSTILKSYYSEPQLSTTTFGVSYCDRSIRKPATSDLSDIGNNYNVIYNFISNKEGSIYRGENLINQLNQAVNTQSGINKMKFRAHVMHIFNFKLYPFSRFMQQKAIR